jgi:hypothetical protein
MIISIILGFFLVSKKIQRVEIADDRDMSIENK